MQNDTAEKKAEPKVYKIEGEAFEHLAILDDQYKAAIDAANVRLDEVRKEEDAKVLEAHRKFWEAIEAHLNLPKDKEHEVQTDGRAAGIYLVREKPKHDCCNGIHHVATINLGDLIRKAAEAAKKDVAGNA